MRVLLIGLLAASGLSAQVNLYSIEKENATGKELAKGLEKHFTLVQSDVVEELGRQLVSTIPDIPFNITFRVFESAKVQARQIPAQPAFPQNLDTVGFLEPLVLPGGWIFVPSRMLRDLSRDELAAGLAHAISHVKLRHCTRLATRGELVERSSAGLPNHPPVLQEPIGLLKLARAFELQADAEAVPMLEQIGFSKASLRMYLQKLPPVKRVMFASSPSPEERVNALQ